MGEGRQSRAVRWVLLFSLLFVLLISCSQSRTYQISVASGRVVPRFGGSLTVGIVGSPGVLNPLLAQTPNAEQIDELIYQGLTCIGSHGVPYPCLASSWQVQNGGKNYIFYLRKGVKFANGELFDAQDVIDTVSILTSSSFQNVNPSLYNTWQHVTAKELNKYEVEFDLPAPSSSFLVAAAIGILPYQAFQNGVKSLFFNSHNGAKAYGTGPYRVEGFYDNGARVTLVRNPYYKPKPYISSISFESFSNIQLAAEALERGEIDMLPGIQPNMISQLEQHAGIHFASSLLFDYVDILFNQSSGVPYFHQLAVREAFALAVRRRQILNKVLKGYGVVDIGPIPPSLWAYESSIDHSEYNLAQANLLLEKSGWVYTTDALVMAKGKKFPKAVRPIRWNGKVALEPTLVVPDMYPYPQVARILAADWSKIGAKVKVKVVPSVQFVINYLESKKFDLALTAWDIGPDPNQLSIWSYQAESSPNGYNFTSMPKDVFVDHYLQVAATTTSKPDVLKAYTEFANRLNSDIPALFLYDPDYIVAFSNVLKHIQLPDGMDPSGLFSEVGRWYIYVAQVKKR